jgi:class 3 adenylate cyclase
LAFEPEDEKLVVTVANLAAASIRNARLFEELGETNRSAQRFVPHEFVRFLDRAHLKELARGQSVNRAMTVLFSDLRSFTSVVENLDPAATFELLNGYLAAMVPPIEAHSGFIDKFIGDAIMALFDDRTADAALESAIEQHRALGVLNASRGGIALEMGIGLHTGPLTLGVVGSEERLSATVYGDSVNLASRVEGLTRVYGGRILLTDSTRAALSNPERFALRFVDRVRVKGKDQPVGLWECLDALTDDERAARADEVSMRTARREYDAGSFAEAERLLREICSRCPQDPLPAAWLMRVTELSAQSPAHWDGTVRLDKK